MAPIASTGAATEVISNTAFIEDDRVLRAAEKRGGPLRFRRNIAEGLRIWQVVKATDLLQN
ncbi:MAG: hypothetical protein AB8B45_02805, partial [Prochlorococcus sp.]